MNSCIPTVNQTSYDNWNGGIYYYAIYITVNVDLFIKDASGFEMQILDTLNQITVGSDDEIISEVKILPIIQPLAEGGIDGLEVRIEEPRFWKPGYFKLFLSHLATYKKNTSLLKNALEQYGISAFVAHEDIEPAKEWQQEIEHGLYSMDALCAILMKGFKESNWTDQEVGVAVGRNVLVIPIIKDINPYGFIGKFQGFKAEGKGVSEVAAAIFEILSTHSKTSGLLIIKLSELFLLSTHGTDALTRIKALMLIKSIPKERVEIIKTRVVENDILKSTKILTEVNQLLVAHELTQLTSLDFVKEKVKPEDDLPF